MFSVIGKENVKLSGKQIEELLELLDKEETLEVQNKIEKALQKQKEYDEMMECNLTAEFRDMKAKALAEERALYEKKKQEEEQKKQKKTGSKAEAKKPPPAASTSATASPVKDAGLNVPPAIPGVDPSKKQSENSKGL